MDPAEVLQCLLNTLSQETVDEATEQINEVLENDPLNFMLTLIEILSQATEQRQASLASTNLYSIIMHNEISKDEKIGINCY